MVSFEKIAVVWYGKLVSFDKIAVVWYGKLILTFVYSVVTPPLKIGVYKGDKIVILNLLDMLLPRRSVVENLKIVKDGWSYPILHNIKSKRKENERNGFHFKWPKYIG
jgi:hypothetical protein